MMGHTPGPYRLQYLCEDLVIETEDGREIGEAYYHDIEELEAEANARLWVAAPDLLAACDERGLTSDDATADLLDQLAERRTTSPNGLRILASELRERTATRRTAVAKAKGDD